MKKFLRCVVLALVLFIPFSVNAEDKFNFVADDDATIENDVVGSSLVAGNNVTSSNSVEGINMLFGNNVNYKSDSDYALVAGNNVNIFGNIKNDGFIFGNLISFGSEFNANRDIFVFGNTVTLKGKINRDITIYATSVVVENTIVEGDITIHTSTLEIKGGVEVKGTLSYSEDAKAEIEPNAVISSTKLLDSLNTKVTVKDKIYSFFVSYAGILVIFLVLAFIVPKLFERIENKYKDIKLFDIFSSLGFGALLLIFVPVIFILLLTMVIGIPLAILLLIIYILAVWLSVIFSGYLLGLVIWKKFIKKDINILLVGLIGISIISLLQVIPNFGFYITIIGMMIGLGIIFKLLKRD